MSAELQTLSIGLTTLVILWLLHSTTDIAVWVGLKKEKKNVNNTQIWYKTYDKSIW